MYKKFIFIFCLFINYVSKCYAYDIELNGLYYNVDIESSVATVTTGDNEYIGILNIPESIDFRNKKFVVNRVDISNMPNLVSILLPNTIYYLSLSKCGKIHKLTLPEDLTDLYCHLVNLETLRLPNKIKSFSLSDCESLRKLDNIPETLDTIRPFQFSGCKSLKEFKIGKYVKHIGKQAFYNCSNLLGIVIPANVKSIDYAAFSGCEKLEFVTIDYSNLPLIIHTASSSSFPDACYRYGMFSGSRIKKIIIDRDLEEYSYIHGVSKRQGNGLWGGDTPKIIEIGEHLNIIPFNPDNNTKEILVHSIDPFQIKVLTTDNNYRLVKKDYSFPKETFLYGTLYVPIGTKENYIKAEMWKSFLDIQEVDYDIIHKRNIQISYTGDGNVKLNNVVITSDYNTQLQDCSIININTICDDNHYLEKVSFSNKNISDSFCENEYSFVLWDDININLEFGRKKEYIEINGTKWTKGNLQYLEKQDGNPIFQNHYRLAPHQWDVLHKIEFETKDIFEKRTTNVELWTNQYCRLPSKEEANALIKTSCQIGYYINEDDTKIYGLLFIDSTLNQSISGHYSTHKDSIKRFDSRDMEIGLFLPCTTESYTRSRHKLEGYRGSYWTSNIQWGPVTGGYGWQQHSILCGINVGYEEQKYNNYEELTELEIIKFISEYAETALIRPVWIKTDEYTEIKNNLSNFNDSPQQYYDLFGRKINKVTNGIYIIKTNNGNFKKVLIKNK